MSNTQNRVEPEGFDMRNALASSDVVFPISDGTRTAETWGLMIIADRKAGMCTYLRAVPTNGFARAAAERIGRVLRSGAGNMTAAIY